MTSGEMIPVRHLASHLGSRLLPAQIGADRILMARDHVILGMPEGLGAAVAEIVAPFQPVHGASHGHSHA